MSSPSPFASSPSSSRARAIGSVSPSRRLRKTPSTQFAAIAEFDPLQSDNDHNDNSDDESPQTSTNARPHHSTTDSSVPPSTPPPADRDSHRLGPIQPSLSRNDTVTPLSFKRQTSDSKPRLGLGRIGDALTRALPKSSAAARSPGSPGESPRRHPIASTSAAAAHSLSSSAAGPSSHRNMPSQHPRQISIPARPRFFGPRGSGGVEDSALDDSATDADLEEGERTPTASMFNHSKQKGEAWSSRKGIGAENPTSPEGGPGRNASAYGHGRHLNRVRASMAGSAMGSPRRGLGESGIEGGGGKVPIPHALPKISAPEDSNPLPTIPMTVLCIAMLGEFLSASVAGPFLFFMIEGFGVGEGVEGGGEAAVGFWAGIVSAVFFLSQFITSMLWANASDKHGRRAVLFVSLLGNACTLLLFGTSQNLASALVIRMGQGLFNGSVGVARSAVRDITDPTNEGRAYTLMGFCWGMGGIVGPIIGGLLADPVKNVPGFGDSVLFANYPYLLPCMIASSVTFLGAILSLFLGWNGGPRSGAVQLPVEKNAVPAASPNVPTTTQHSFGSIPRRLSRRLSGMFGNGTPPARVVSLAGIENSSHLGDERNPLSLSRTASRQSGVIGYGTAYGYDSKSRWSGRRDTGASQYRNRRPSVAASTQYAPDIEQVEETENVPELNFAQRLLLANEPAVFSISDIWVAAAQNDDTYSVADYDVNDEDEGDGSSIIEHNEDDYEDNEGFAEDNDGFGYDGSETPSIENLRGRAQLDAVRMPANAIPESTPGRGRSRRPSVAPSDRARYLSPSFRAASPTGQSYRAISTAISSHGARRPSVASSVRMPALFHNTGLATPPHVYGSSPYGQSGAGNYFDAVPGRAGTPPPMSTQPDRLKAIPESRLPPPSSPAPVPGAGVGGPADPSSLEAQATKPLTPFQQLPMALIAQYAMLALHGTTCDQVFMSFLVTPVASGGLGLNASHYAELIAMMCFCQMAFQFRFYPTVGPPRGKLSHLAMFRLGLAIYIPVYLLFPFLRGLLHERGNGMVMFGMTLLSAFRYLSNVCSYTAVMVLTNALTPPHLIPLANGLAQSAVSAARFCGPVLGGIIWAWSISGGPDARPYPLNYALGFVVIAVLCGVGLLHSLRL